jgi:Meiotically up-regulated gene 113
VSNTPADIKASYDRAMQAIDALGGPRLRSIVRRKMRPRARDHPKTCVYVVGFSDYVKIGRSTDFQSRFLDLQQGVPERLIIYGTFPARGKTSVELEARLHQRFIRHRASGEWFFRTGKLAAWIEDGCWL